MLYSPNPSLGSTAAASNTNVGGINAADYAALLAANPLDGTSGQMPPQMEGQAVIPPSCQKADQDTALSSPWLQERGIIRDYRYFSHCTLYGEPCEKNVFSKGVSLDDMTEITMRSLVFVMQSSPKVLAAKKYLQEISGGIVHVVCPANIPPSHPGEKDYNSQKETYSPLIERQHMSERTLQCGYPYGIEEFYRTENEYFAEVNRLLSKPIDTKSYAEVNRLCEIYSEPCLSENAYLEAEYIACVAVFFYSVRVLPDIFPFTHAGYSPILDWHGGFNTWERDCP